MNLWVSQVLCSGNYNILYIEVEIYLIQSLVIEPKSLTIDFQGRIIIFEIGSIYVAFIIFEIGFYVGSTPKKRHQIEYEGLC